jgi:Family of unknown function (DUF6152)
MRKSMTRAARRIIILASLITGVTSLAVAHHSYSAFDMTGEKTVTGTIKKFDYTNPHSWIWIDVQNESGAVETWGIEGMSPNYLSRRGWSRTTLKPGDKVSITFHPLRDGKGGSFVSGKRDSGETLGMTGAITTP